MLKSILAALAVAVLAATAVKAQQPPQPAPASLDAGARKAAVDKAAELLRTRYVYPDVGAKAGARIEAQLTAGAYDGLSEPSAFAERLTGDLAEVAHDKHLRVMTPGGPPPAGRPLPPRSEAGIVRADRLPGGYGYIEVMGFPPMEVFKPALDKAMASVAGSKGLIVDLRRNGGGDPRSVGYFVSHFIPDGTRTHINDLIWRNPGGETYRTDESWSVATPTKFLRKPLYLLTSKWTFSGGEEFAYDMQTLKLGTVVGETTGGGANPGGTQPIGPGMMIFLPGGRAVNPITKTSWEGKGVAPDLAVAPDEALRVALQKLGQKPAAADIDSLTQAQLFQPRTVADARSEAALRQSVEGWVKGTPRYDLLNPQFAELTRQQEAQLKATIQKLGALQSITFKEVGPQGADIYEVKFANGSTRWNVIMGGDGKIVGAGFRPD